MNTERDNWKDITPNDATESELTLVHLLLGSKPQWMDNSNWRTNMEECAKWIREHVRQAAKG